MEEFSGDWFPWSLGGPWGQYFLQCSFPDVEKVKRAAFHVDTIIYFTFMDWQVEVYEAMSNILWRYWQRRLFINEETAVLSI